MFRLNYRSALGSLSLALFLTACAVPARDSNATDSLPAPPTARVSDATRNAPVVVEAVQVNVLESNPPQLSLEITGYIPDGCEVPVEIRQQREGNTVQVELNRELPADQGCTAIVRDYEGTVRLDGSFSPGSYQIEVNDFRLEQQL